MEKMAADLRLIAKKAFSKDFNRSGFTLAELMAVIVTIGLLAATALGSFSAYLARTKATEAITGVSKMATGEIELYQKAGHFVAAGPTNIPPSTNKQVVSFTGNWIDINFTFTDSVLFGYQAVAGANSVDCEALGDLDGDGDTSIYRRTVNLVDGKPEASGVFIFDELE